MDNSEVIYKLPNILTIKLFLNVEKDNYLDKCCLMQNSMFRYSENDEYNYKEEIKLTDLINRINMITPQNYIYNMIKTYEDITNNCNTAFKLSLYKLKQKENLCPIDNDIIIDLFELVDSILLDCLQSDKAYYGKNTPEGDKVYFEIQYEAKDGNEIFYNTESPNKIIIKPYD